MILYVLVIVFVVKGLNENAAFMVMNQVVLILIMTPHIYWVYKWTMNVSYKGYDIKWETNSIQSMAKILKELLLTLFSVGIYYPVAITKLDEYFVKLTKVSHQNVLRYSFRAKFNYLSVWKIMWTQFLLTIFTLGIYGAWAYCRVVKLMVDHTSLIKNEGNKT
jgi:uncharacterized membrane protein YjgN (DUF898 family)